MARSNNKKTPLISKIINVLLVIFIVFLAVLFIRGKMKKKEEGTQFYGGYNYEILNGDVVLEEYLGSEEEIVVPSEVEGKKVVSIAKDTFKNNTYVKKIVIPGSVRAVGVSAFKGCINLESLEIEEGTEFIASYAFRNCKALKTVKLPDSLTEIGYGAFMDAGDFTVFTSEGSVAGAHADSYGYKVEYRK